MASKERELLRGPRLKPVIYKNGLNKVKYGVGRITREGPGQFINRKLTTHSPDAFSLLIQDRKMPLSPQLHRDEDVYVFTESSTIISGNMTYGTDRLPNKVDPLSFDIEECNLSTLVTNGQDSSDKDENNVLEDSIILEEEENRITKTPTTKSFTEIMAASTPDQYSGDSCLFLQHLSPGHSSPQYDDRYKIYTLCNNQLKPMPLIDSFTPSMILTLTKLGEGTFAEVFGCNNEEGMKLALKIVPIEGGLYNGEFQHTFSSILPEMVITKELGLLGEPDQLENGKPNYTRNFLQIYSMKVCSGRFPQILLDVWNEYGKRKGSNNDHPGTFSKEQLYIVFVAKNSGIPLEDFLFTSFQQALSILQQVSATLAVGETALEFEHRDLHWGNILIAGCNYSSIPFRIGSIDHLIETHGICATIVDYSLSRIKHESCVSYCDLNKFDWLFQGKADIQFEVYRSMRQDTNGEWMTYTPHSNVLWLHYILLKLSHSVQLDGPTRRSWRAHFRTLLKEVKGHNSAQQVFYFLQKEYCNK